MGLVDEKKREERPGYRVGEADQHVGERDLDEKRRMRRAQRRSRLHR
jgi:hypothetical protein